MKFGNPAPRIEACPWLRIGADGDDGAELIDADSRKDRAIPSPGIGREMKGDWGGPA